MAYLLIAFLLVAIVPLLAASWRVSLLGLALQGLLLGWMALRADPHASLSLALTLVDLVVLRAILAPSILHRALVRHGAPRRNDVIPSDLFSWAFVGALVFLSFRFAMAALKADLESSLHMAVAVAALLLGMFVLASQNSMLSQMIGILRIENGVALGELMWPHSFPLPIRVGVSAVFLLTILLFGRFLRDELRSVDEPLSPGEGPSL